MADWKKKTDAAPPTGQALLERIHFIDIEVVSQKEIIDNDEHLFMKRFKYLWDRQTPIPGVSQIMATWQKIYEEQAGLHAEHGKICNISLGKMVGGKFYVKSYTGTDEKQILTDAYQPMSTANVLCAHNGQEFDYPIYTRRCIINDLPIPPILNVFGKKPWDVADQLYDTMKMWSHTAWNYRCSQDLIAHVLGIPTSKSEIDGSKMHDLYYGSGDFATMSDEDRLQAIGKYGIGDVVALARIYCRLKGIATITDEQITWI